MDIQNAQNVDYNILSILYIHVKYLSKNCNSMKLGFYKGTGLIEQVS